jgi:hypothetical protein
MITFATLVTESSFQLTPSGASSAFRNIARGRVEFPAADAGLSQYLTPIADTVYTFDNFPAVHRNGAVITNDVGLPAAFARLHLLHLRIAAYRPDLPSSGTVGVVLTDMFGTGALDFGALDIGDELPLTRKREGFLLLSTSALVLTVTDPVNLAIEMIIAGKETAGGVSS